MRILSSKVSKFKCVSYVTIPLYDINVLMLITQFTKLFDMNAQLFTLLIFYGGLNIRF